MDRRKCSNIPAQRKCWVGACLTLAAFIVPSAAYEADPRYIFVSSPTKKNIYYAPLPTFTELSKPEDDRPAPKAQVLIDGTIANCSGPEMLCTESSDQGLEQPEGLALWHGKNKAVLFVADSAASAIYAYEISASLSPDPTQLGSLQAGPQQLVVKGISTVAGLALDGFGNLYFSTTDGSVGKLAASTLYPLNSPVSEILYASDSTTKLSSPFGLAADNFNVYWANQANGQTEGVLIKAFERNGEALKKKYPDMPTALAKNAAKAVGVCVAKGNVFFTGAGQYLYGVKSAGGGVVEVSSDFDSPAGCAYDGDNTLYVADTKAGAVYSLPGNFLTLRKISSVQKVAEAESPTGVAVFTRAERYLLQPADNGFLGLGW